MPDLALWRREPMYQSTKTLSKDGTSLESKGVVGLVYLVGPVEGQWVGLVWRGLAGPQLPEAASDGLGQAFAAAKEGK